MPRTKRKINRSAQSKANKRDYARRRYAELKAAGRCTHCGEPAGGATRCEGCALTVRGFWQKRQARGECPKCRRPHVGRFFLCPTCRRAESNSNINSSAAG